MTTNQKPGCEHICSGNCRREGCNCACGEFHCDSKDECRYKDEGDCPNHTAPNADVLAEFRKKAHDIIGLEVDPRGQDEMYLIRDEDGQVTDGIEFTEELDELCEAVNDLLTTAIEKDREEVRGMIEKIYADEKEHGEKLFGVENSLGCAKEKVLELLARLTKPQ